MTQNDVVKNDGFFGSFNTFLGGAKDTFSTLLEGGLLYEQYQAKKDQVGQGQVDSLDAVTKASNTNAAPIDANQYNAVAKGNAQTTPQAGLQLSTNTMLIGGAAVLALVLLLK